MSKNFILAAKESERRRKEGWTDEQRAEAHGFPSAEVYREWREARNEALRCRKVGDPDGEAIAKEKYRSISWQYLGHVKPNHAKWHEEIGHQSPSQRDRDWSEYRKARKAKAAT